MCATNLCHTVDSDETMLRAVFEHSPEAIMVVDANGVIEMCNRSSVRLFGHTEEYLVGTCVEACLAVNRPETMLVTEQWAWWTDVARSPHDAETNSGNGCQTPLEVAVSALYPDQQSHFLVSIRDLSEQRKIERILAEKPLRDPESGLYGSQMLPLFLGEELDRAMRHGHPMALVLIEFTAIGNDAFFAATAAVADYVRISDKALRIGNRRLALLLPETTGWEAESLSGRLRKILIATALMSCDQPVERQKIAIGTASFPRNGETMQQIMAIAQARLEQDML